MNKIAVVVGHDKIAHFCLMYVIIDIYFHFFNPISIAVILSVAIGFIKEKYLSSYFDPLDLFVTFAGGIFAILINNI